MIQNGRALTYVHNGLQFIRLQAHERSDTHSMGTGTELGGRSEGSGPTGVLQGVSLDVLADFFGINGGSIFSRQ